MSKKVIRSINRILQLESKRLDEIRLELAHLQNRIAQVQKDIQALDLAVGQERTLSSENIEAAQSYSVFMLRVQNQKKQYLETLHALENEEEEVREKLRDKFIDTKTYEQLLKKKTDALEAEEKLNETKVLDEIALRRKK